MSDTFEGALLMFLLICAHAHRALSFFSSIVSKPGTHLTQTLLGPRAVFSFGFQTIEGTKDRVFE